MGYTPTVWQTGDIVTSEKLNKIENGIADAVGVLVVTMSGDSMTTDKTWQEIYDALAARKEVVLVMSVDTEEQKLEYRDRVISASYPDEQGGVNPYSITTQDGSVYVASADDYLSMA